MTVAAFVLALASVFVAVGCLMASVPRARLLRGAVRRRTIVTLKSGESFGGVLFDADRSCMVLRNAELLSAGDRPVPVDGEVLILRPDVAYLQLP